MALVDIADFFLVGFMPVLLEMFSIFSSTEIGLRFCFHLFLGFPTKFWLVMRWWAGCSFPWGFRELWKDGLWSINLVGIVIVGHHTNSKSEMVEAGKISEKSQCWPWRDYNRAAKHPTKNYLFSAARYRGHQQLRPRLGWRRRRRGWRRGSNRRDLRETAETMGLRGP